MVPANRLIATPGTRCNASVTERSGSAPMSVAVIASTTVSELRLMFCAFARLCRIPVTTMSSPPRPRSSVAAVVPSWGSLAAWAAAMPVVEDEVGPVAAPAVPSPALAPVGDWLAPAAGMSCAWATPLIAAMHNAVADALRSRVTMVWLLLFDGATKRIVILP
ncbi:hypothetical protein ACU5AX_15005 [Sphingomonas sp. XXL09]|uniref:hypothetical protein n=1 Tax=Sphingomonas sp. XXL09 TaxID=3457787 RepID=UPI00406BAC65